MASPTWIIPGSGGITAQAASSTNIAWWHRFSAPTSFGEALDTACRLLDAPEAKAALRAAPGPLLLVVSSHIHHSLAGHEGFRPLVTTQIAGREHRGWVWVFAPIWA
jgi:hypothetical protein